MVYKFSDKKTAGSDIKSMLQNEPLAEELHKPIIKKIQKKKSVFSIQRQYLGCWFGRYAINNLIKDLDLSYNLIKDLDFYYVLLIFLANMLGLFL